MTDIYHQPDAGASAADGMRAKRIAVRRACLVARRTPTYSEGGAAALAAIEAAEAWLADPTEERRLAARSAGLTAFAEDAAAYAAYAASAEDSGAAAAYAEDAAVYAVDEAEDPAAELEAQRADLDRLLGGAE